MKRYGILCALLIALVLAFTLINGCSTPKKATTEEMTKPTTPAGPSQEELARQKADQEARERAQREQHHAGAGQLRPEAAADLASLDPRCLGLLR